MREAKNYKGHYLDDIFADIKNQGYAERDAVIVTNLFKDVDLKEYFNQHNLNIRSEHDKYIFTKLKA